MHSDTEALRIRLRATHIKRVAIARRAGVQATTITKFMQGSEALWGTQERIKKALDGIEDDAIAMRMIPAQTEAA